MKTKMIYLIQGANIVILLGMLILPFVIAFFLVKWLKKRNEQSQTLEQRLEVLERRISDIEEYMNESDYFDSKTEE